MFVEDVEVVVNMEEQRFRCVAPEVRAGQISN